MTGVTVRKFFVERLVMRHPVAGHTLGNPLVLILVAVNTQEIPVLSGGLCQLLGFRRMTSGAEARRNKVVVSDLGGHMRLMAAEAVFIDHVRRMRIVALLTLEKLSVTAVAFRTIEQRMRARIVLQLLSLMGMTGRTGRRDPRRSRELDIPGTVGGMTAEAVADGIVTIFFRLVATGAFGDRPRPPGRMLDMTIQTGHSCLVQAATTFNIPNLLLVAILAIVRFEVDEHTLGPNRSTGEDPRCEGYNRQQRQKNLPMTRILELRLTGTPAPAP